MINNTKLKHKSHLNMYKRNQEIPFNPKAIGNMARPQGCVNLIICLICNNNNVAIIIRNECVFCVV